MTATAEDDGGGWRRRRMMMAYEIGRRTMTGKDKSGWKKSIEFALAEPPQLLASTVDSDKTDAEGRFPRCGDEAARSGLGVAVPQAMQSPIAAGHHGVPFSLK
jgi:hypothetical protein